ncbi:MAG: carboxypeptidase regulatory-like domain-containing protein [Candidatus Omnitrophica bacterium]|nr:carboxypeptidase regulatory-like domain-containing protein [Candidatus Omnitrophota bacterium]
MKHAQRSWWLPIAGILVAIGCGGAKPQNASATNDAPKQVAQAPTDSSPASASSQGSAMVHGTVKLAGSAPAPERVKMDADPQCQLQHKEPVQKQDVVVNPDGTLQHVFVYVKQGLEGRTFPASTKPVMLDQQGCLYHPHVLGIQTNQPLEIVNNDATLHNVNCKPTKSKPFNIAQPTKGMKSTKTFTAPEIMVKCACNVHPWMGTYIGVVEHPFFSVTGEDGSFTLTGLPAGHYTLEAWHEKYGTQTQTVIVGDGETKQVAFEFKAQ